MRERTTPSDSGPRASDVLCVFDQAGDEGWFTLLLNRPTEVPAQPMAFGLFDCGEDCVWWGGPTQEVFALVQLVRKVAGSDDEYLRTGAPRRYVTAHTGVWLPGRDHRPSTPERLRVFSGCVWLSAAEVAHYQEQGLTLVATDDRLFDPNLATPRRPAPFGQMKH